MKKDKALPIPLIASVFIMLIIGIIGFAVFRGGTFTKANRIEEGKATKIQVESNGQTLIVDRNGTVELKTSEGSFFDQWIGAKTQAFFDYFEKKFAEGEILIGEDTITFYENGTAIGTSTSSGDELIPEVISDAQDPDTGGGDGGDEGEDVTPYFSPTPSPPPGSTNPPGPTPTPPSGGGSGSSECLFWKVSYCVTFRPPPPTGTPTPSGPSIILPPDCGDTGNQGTGRTVISNELCVTPEPSPTP